MTSVPINETPIKRRKKMPWIIFALILVAALILGAILLYQNLVSKVKKDGIVYLHTGEEYHVVSSYESAAYPTPVVLAELNGLPVTTITEGAFESNTALTSITLPSTLKVIESHAFKNCLSLLEVKIEATAMDKIGDEAFYGCTALESIIMPETLTAFGKSVFHNCTVLTVFSLPSGLTELPEKLFYNSERLSSITLPETLTLIGAQAFADCTMLHKIYVPASLKEVKKSAFEGCNMLGEVHAKSLSAWCGITFENNTANPLSQTRALYINDTLVTDIVFPSDVTEIKPFAFYSFKGLQSVTFPAGFTHIGANAFEKCSSLTTVTLSPSMATIDKNAFNSCTSISRVNISDLSAWCGISFASLFSNPLYFSQILHVNDTPVTDLVIPTDVAIISPYAFCNYDMLKTVTLHDNVHVIGSGAFYSCNLLLNITLPAGLSAIGADAFYGCYKLIEVYNLSSLALKKGATSNGDVALYAKDIYIDSAAPTKTFTDENGFLFYEHGSDCYLINYIGSDGALTLPENCHGKKYKIYNYAFYQNKHVTKIKIGTGVTEIGVSAFESCTKLAEVEIGSDVYLVDQHAFNHCDSLAKATFKNRSGWHLNIPGNPQRLYISNAKTAAEYLCKTYISYQWRRL